MDFNEPANAFCVARAGDRTCVTKKINKSIPVLEAQEEKQLNRVRAVLQAARNGCALTNNARRVGGHKTLRRFAAPYSERPRSLRRALNMNAKYAGDQPDTA